MADRVKQINRENRAAFEKRLAALGSSRSLAESVMPAGALEAIQLLDARF